MSTQGELFPTAAIPGPTAPAPKTKTKLTARSVCLCGHERRAHHIGAPKQHDGGWYCLQEHCAYTTYRDGVFTECQCPGFQLTATAPLKRKRPSAGDYDPCATCHHIRGHHCTPHPLREKKAPAPMPCEDCSLLRSERYWGRNCPRCGYWSKQEWKARRAAEWKAAGTRPKWLGFEFEGRIGHCKHVDESNPTGDVRCDSSACAWSDDGVTFCSCQKYKSPWAKAAKPATTPNLFDEDKEDEDNRDPDHLGEPANLP